MRTAVGLVEVTSVDRVPVDSLAAADARRAGAASLAALRQGWDRVHPDRPGVSDRAAVRRRRPAARVGGAVPDAAEIDAIVAWLDLSSLCLPTAIHDYTR